MKRLVQQGTITTYKLNRELFVKEALRKLCSPILNLFEADDGPFSYRESHRTILVAVGCLFLILSGIGVAAGIRFQQMGAVFPCVIFFGVGFTCLVVGSLGSDRAVAKIWGNKSLKK